jgi:hypothetical protein
MSTRVATQFHLGAPQITGALAVYPIFGGDPQFHYRSLAAATALGAFVSEVDPHGSVNEVLVCNVTDQPLLVYEGELIEGARQNRTIEMPVLVGAGQEVRVPVSCVEQGRWDHGRRAEHFSPARSAVAPKLRRAMRTQANALASAGAQARPAQAAVWFHVGGSLDEHSVESPSAALTDIYVSRRSDLDAIKQEIEVVEGQVGAVAAISGRPVALDLVSRPEVFADLLPRLLDGYALQALGAHSGPGAREGRGGREALLASDGLGGRELGTDDEAAEAILRAALELPRGGLPTVGAGQAFALHSPELDGCGVRVEHELIALSAFPTAPQSEQRAAA